MTAHREPQQLGLPCTWKPMSTAPRDATWIVARVEGAQRVLRVHFAQDLSGEEQPAFSGWFYQQGNSFFEAPHLDAWMSERDYALLYQHGLPKAASEPPCLCGPNEGCPKCGSMKAR